MPRSTQAPKWVLAFGEMLASKAVEIAARSAKPFTLQIQGNRFKCY